MLKETDYIPVQPDPGKDDFGDAMEPAEKQEIEEAVAEKTGLVRKVGPCGTVRWVKAEAAIITRFDFGKGASGG